MLASTSTSSPKSLLAFAALALLALAQVPSPVEASSSPSSALDFDSYVSSRLLSYHAHQASPALNARSVSFPSSHRSNPSHFSSSASSSDAIAPVVYHAAPVAAPPSAAQVKMSRLNSIKSAAKSRGFALVKKAPRTIRSSSSHVKRSAFPALEERTRATTGQVEMRKRLWVRAEPEDAEADEVEEAEGDETAETAAAVGESEDWTWMEEKEGEEAEEEDESNLSSAARMEIRMRRTVPLFHRDP